MALVRWLCVTQDMKNPLDRRQKQLNDDARGSFQYFLKVSSNQPRVKTL